MGPLYIRTQYVPHSKHSPSSLYITTLLMLCKAQVPVCSEIRAKHMDGISLALNILQVSFTCFLWVWVCWDSAIIIATRYGLDGLGIESRWGATLSTPVQTFLEAHPASFAIGIWSLLGTKRPERGVDNPPPSSAEVNPLKPELNPICYLLALLGAHHFLHVSRIRVKLLTLR
jgi:hypothetical protein